MARLRANRLQWLLVLISSGIIAGCGGSKPPGPSPFPAKITLTPGGTTSIQQGNVVTFTASAQNASNGTIGATFTFASSDTSILNLSSNGVACAGHWDTFFTTCTPGGTGVVQVTASALGVSSIPTFVFVHPPIDNITVRGVLLDGLPIQEPCLSQGQTMTVEAHAYSQGADITSTVGPFTWAANNFNVVKLTPLVNSAYNFATNQATATAVTPGITGIFATANGVSSTSFVQPQPYQGINLNFFETCPIQNITLELGHAGSGQTTFAIAKGTSQTVIATVTDVMGNSSLPNTIGGIVLSKIPLTWSASQPAVIGAGTSCTLSCTVTTPSPGAGSVTASCSPPTCNIGFPQAPPGSIVPLPVYATTAISGLLSGTTASTSVLATSLGCAGEPPADCTTSIYSFTTTKVASGAENPMPVSPNSLLYDLTGDKLYMGSDFGAQVLTPANLGTTTSAFAALGTVTGNVLAISNNGALAVFSDTKHVPNQVYVVNATNAGSPSATALNISGGSAAAFSPDGLKAFIFGYDANGNPNLYVYSALQALQAIPLAAGTTVQSIAFSTNGAFAYLVEPSVGGGGPALTVYNTCDNQISTSPPPGLTQQVIPLSATPIAFRTLPDGLHFVSLGTGGNIDYITATITGIPPATLTTPSNSLCPMTVDHTGQTINLEQGNINPINFFTSADGTLLYVAASDRNSILIYDLATGSPAGGIQLAPTAGAVNPTPISAEMTADASTILVAASDGYVHQVTTALGGSDQIQTSFPDVPNFPNPFCSMNPSSGSCTLDFIAVKP
jgi:hypothetical protein